ncbi:MAG: cytochrome c3 family protein, partial [bacterium]
GKDKALADLLLKDALHNIQLVKQGKGVHNIQYSKNLIYSSKKILEHLQNPTSDGLAKLVDELEKPSAPSDRNCTNICHVQPPTEDIPFGSAVFPHGKHSAEIDCAQCHSTAEHGKTLLTTKGCGVCHKRLSENKKGHTNCIACHNETDWTFAGAARCLNCHTTIKRKSLPAGHKDCMQCHKPHTWKPSAETALCSSCHKQIAREVAGAAGMDSCGICHQPHQWTFGGIETCRMCHDKSTLPEIHSLPDFENCSDCHIPHRFSIE